MDNVTDFRSDTVTSPTPAMRQAMFDAALGDDVYGEDPSVNHLEAGCAELLSKDAALWLPSGTQANLVAILSHCRRGDEYLVGQQAHCYRFEGGGAAICGGVQPQPLELRDDGTLDLDDVVAAVKPLDHHFARTRLLCLENTQAGSPLPREYPAEARRVCDQFHLSMHLDGARLFNAAIACGDSVSSLARPFDSVSVCLSKGLGAPAGTVLAGSGAFIAEARRWRKVLGGGMRQAGVLASAGSYALAHHVDRLSDDHARALQLAQGLANYPDLQVDLEHVATNMVFAYPEASLQKRYQAFLESNHILVGGYGKLRFVTHLDIDDDDVARALEVTRMFFHNLQQRGA